MFPVPVWYVGPGPPACSVTCTVPLLGWASPELNFRAARSVRQMMLHCLQARS